MGRTARARALFLAGLLVSALFSWLAVRHVRLHEVWHGLQESNYWWLVPALAALAVANVLRALRWQYLFRAETRPPFEPTLSAMLLGQFFNNVLPARAGEAARIVALNQTARTSRAEAAGTVVVERAYDVLSVLVLLFVLLPWLPHVTWLRTAAVFAIALTVALVAAFVVLARYGERPVRVLLRPLAFLPFVSLERTQEAAVNLVHGLAALRRPRLALVGLTLTTVSWLVLAVTAWCVMQGFHQLARLSFVAAVLVMIATGLGQILPSTAASLGVFEAATQLALRPFGFSSTASLSYALVFHAANFIPYVVAGVVVLQTHTLALRRR